MDTPKPNRRAFVRGALTGSVATAVLIPAAAASSGGEKNAAGKKVIYKSGEKPSSGTILSSGIQFGQTLFVSGQGAHHPETHQVVEGPFPNQVRRCLDNLKIVLEAAGSSLDRVLKCTVFLTDITNFKAMNEVYHTYFPTDPPARSTIAVKDLPGDSPIEIECIAYVP